MLRDDPTINLLGALALAVTDAVQETAEETAGHAGQGPAAIVSIGALPGLSIGELAEVLRLTHPGAVRLVERLVDDGLVEKGPARDGRAVALKLTPPGKQRRRDVLATRARRLQPFLNRLSATERKQFDGLLRKLLSGLITERPAVYTLCRLCDVGPCMRNDCPVERGLPPENRLDAQPWRRGNM